MGKITGFMEYERLEEGYRPVEERGRAPGGLDRDDMGSNRPYGNSAI